MVQLVKLNIDGFHDIKEEINSKIAFNEGYVDKMCLELNFARVLCIVCLFACNSIYKKKNLYIVYKLFNNNTNINLRT